MMKWAAQKPISMILLRLSASFSYSFFLLVSFVDCRCEWFSLRVFEGSLNYFYFFYSFFFRFFLDEETANILVFAISLSHIEIELKNSVENYVLCAFVASSFGFAWFFPLLEVPAKCTTNISLPIPVEFIDCNQKWPNNRSINEAMLSMKTFLLIDTKKKRTSNTPTQFHSNWSEENEFLSDLLTINECMKCR